MQHANTVTRRDRRRGGRVLAVAAALIGAGVLVAACGGGAQSPSVANVSSSKTSTSSTSSSASSLSPSGGGSAPSTSSDSGVRSGFAIANGGNRNDALKFSQCMRSHGVPNFPDPNASGVIQGDFNPSTPAFQSASQACRKYMGKGAAPTPAQTAQAQAQALKFSQCMRAHGVKSFPDPGFGPGGEISIKIRAARGSSGLDPSSPIFQSAQKACQSIGFGPRPLTGKAAG